MFGRKKNDRVEVTKDSLQEIKCSTKGTTGERTVTFITHDGREVMLDQTALEAEAVALARHVELQMGGATGTVSETIQDLAVEMQSRYEEHLKTCPNCRSKRAGRAQA